MAKESAKLKIDQRLFAAWQSGDPAAREQIWAELWTVLYHVAFNECYRGCHDQSVAAELAQDALSKTWLLMERWEIEWQGQDSFVALALKCVRKCCLGELEAYRKRTNPLLSLEREGAEGEEESINLLDYLGIGGQSPEAERQAEQIKIEGVRRTVQWLAAAGEACRPKSETAPASVLAQLIEMILAHLRWRLENAALDVRKARKLSWDELVEQTDLDDLQFPKERLYVYLMRSLRINRNTLYQRMLQLRTLLKKLQDE